MKADDRREALGVLYRRYGHLVIGLCLDYLKDKESAKDATMDIFEKVTLKVCRQPRAFDAETVYASAFEPYANDLGGRAMGGNEPGGSVMGRTLAAASLAYDRRDYAAAADSFALQLSTAPAAAATSFYYGLSLLGANRNQQAIDVLSPLVNDAEYGPAANWYRALALLRSKQLPAAKTALSGIANNESSPFKSAAEKLLQRLP
jgi:hypothetical protein